MFQDNSNLLRSYKKSDIQLGHCSECSATLPPSWDFEVSPNISAESIKMNVNIGIKYESDKWDFKLK